MLETKLFLRLGLAIGLAVLVQIGAAGAASAPTVIKTLDLFKPFAARSAWRLTVTQDSDVADPTGFQDDKVPGLIHLCLRKAASAPCDPSLRATVGEVGKSDVFVEPHDLAKLEIVHGLSGQPLLLVQTGSVHSGNGDQLVRTQLLAYRPAEDRFERVYEHLTGHNNNQEVRFVETGPLKGHIVSVEPTQDAPFGFWVVVNAPADGGFKAVLRYRSATRYGDGNPLAVIDSEMPNMAQRLGLWKPGSPLPLPAAACPSPHLVKMALWCVKG
ncbi:MAG TPA: hypothetical protein VNZ85_03780 [Caulobacter sp.]|nr:hypothetical protein [Caulobacter sp.]